MAMAMATILFLWLNNHILTSLLYTYRLILVMDVYCYLPTSHLYLFQSLLGWNWQSSHISSYQVCMMAMATLLFLWLTNHILTSLLYTYRIMLMYVYCCQLVLGLFCKDFLDGIDNHPTCRVIRYVWWRWRMADGDPSVPLIDQPYTH
jgi:hypothetical protein